MRKYTFGAGGHPVVLHGQAAIGCIPMGQGYKILGRQNELTEPSVAPKSQLLTLRQPPNNSRMKLSALSVFSLAVALLLLCFASTTDAGCTQNGCCYCGSQDGLVIQQGRYRERCHPGYECECGYNSRDDTYFGACTDGSSDHRRNNNVAAAMGPGF